MASNRPERSRPPQANRPGGAPLKGVDALAGAGASANSSNVLGEQKALLAEQKLQCELMERACDGDRHAYGQLVQRLNDRLFNAMLRIVGDPEEARELTQETFTRALAKLDSFRGEAGPYTWLFRIGMNLAISQLRKVERHRTFSLDAAMNDGPAGSAGRAAPMMRLASNEDSPLDVLESRERAQQVVAALGRLDPEYRAALVMRDIEGFDYQTMADALNLPLGTLKSRLFRARLALRDELSPYLKGAGKSGNGAARRTAGPSTPATETSPLDSALPPEDISPLDSASLDAAPPSAASFPTTNSMDQP